MQTAQVPQIVVESGEPELAPTADVSIEEPKLKKKGGKKKKKDDPGGTNLKEEIEMVLILLLWCLHVVIY